LRRALRAQLRASRAALPPTHSAHAARAIARHLGRSHWFAPGKRIALYVAMRHELDLAHLMRVALLRGCELYLPRIESERARTMRFVRIGAGLRRGRLGIAEPRGHAAVSARFLHVIVLPTLGVDRYGVRLGYGAGYYDRALSFRRGRHAWRGPRLVAAVFDVQRVDAIPRDRYDVPVDAIVSESGIHFAERSPS
jgi:5-formyltetrahydrofolate cyclo-ligase